MANVQNNLAVAIDYYSIGTSGICESNVRTTLPVNFNWNIYAYKQKQCIINFGKSVFHIFSLRDNLLIMVLGANELQKERPSVVKD